jgi:hypothetical protein
MAITSLAPLLFLAGPMATAPALTAEQALKRYRDHFLTVSELDCPRGSADIVVCGRTGREPDRPPIPYQMKPGDRVRLLPGEPPGASAALASGRMCVRDCPEPIEGSIRNVVKTIGHLLGTDD